ncbi:39S ribosomal protein L20, mitochondrial [Trichogramma pretiosum]|uniref:39S ribosomal protein L20, mitochondrial n=1 Tax=Trichogramma pretiosum TaxID=7493 RepID=UPI0006C9AC3F|nr:39S ribosomal protein L20, mitochondrial [Trichogramma pretiosum]XP_014227542.1 39S ribosomal protein L20, mitochondrial [Trichogramma pretiosum]XP_014227543.1 39S ribosomal protein L20, mitochondrial [Trichogramma pretiosum]
MVFQTLALMTRARGPDEFWRKRRIFRLSSHFRGRFRNCYSMAIRAVHRSLQFATKGRDAKYDIIRQIWMNRIDSAAMEHGLTYKGVKEGLTRSEIHLNHKSLADLAVWEPRTFKSLVNIAHERVKQDGLRMMGYLKAPALVLSKGK